MNRDIRIRRWTVAAALVTTTGLLTVQGAALAHETMDDGMNKPMAGEESMKEMNTGMEVRPMAGEDAMKKPGIENGDMAAGDMTDGGMDNGMKK